MTWMPRNDDKSSKVGGQESSERNNPVIAQRVTLHEKTQ